MLGLVLLIASPGAVVGVAQNSLVLDKEIVLPGVEGRIDHLSVDAEGKRLFVSALGNGTVEVIDLDQGHRIHQITGLKEPQGVLFDSNSKRLFVASGGDGTVRAYDGTSFALLKTVSLGDDADNVRYDAQKKQIVVGYGSGGLASFDTDLNQTSNIKLPSHPESFQLEPKGSRIFVNLPKSFSIEVIDRNRQEIIHGWKQLTVFANFPMALDEPDNRIFVGFRSPARLLIMDTDDGKAVQRLPVPGDTDDLFFDPGSHRVYVIGGEGSVEVFAPVSSGSYKSIGHVQTGSGARTGLLIPSLKLLVVAVPHRGDQRARLLVFRTE
jgi:DNA-binding beta-propeller fold protein YncE